MSGNQSTRFAHIAGVVLSLLLMGKHSAAQRQPATIPTVVAQAMDPASEMFGKAQYFDGITPPSWPAALVPSRAKILGGGVVGDSAMFRMQAAVFDFSGVSTPNEVLRGLLTAAGYVRHDLAPAHGNGGFVGNEPPASGPQYCKGSSLAMFGAVDSVQAPLVIAVQLIDGEAGRQNCAPQRDRLTPGSFPIKVPTLSPPSGTMSFAGGSSWGGSGGHMESILRTTMPADSILLHYTSQLVAGGWRSEGKPAVAEGAGVQRFSFRDGQEAWTAALIVIAVGDQREVLLQFTRSE